MKQAKISISADIKPLKAEMNKARDVFKNFGVDLKNIFSKDLKDQMRIFEQQLSGVTSKLLDMGKAGEKAFDAKHVTNYINQINALSSVIRRVTRQQQAMGLTRSAGGMAVSPSGFSIPPQQQGAQQQAPRPRFTGVGGSSGGGRAPSGGGGGGAGEEGGGLGGGISALAGGATKMLGSLGIGLGVHAAISREIEHAHAEMRVRELSGNGMVGDDSKFNFTRMDRYQRAGNIASEAGRDLTSQHLNRLTDQSEKLERGFGIGGEQFSAAIGSERKAGMGGGSPGSTISNTIGDAVAMKLSGSAVGEYLQQMSAYLDSISKGVNVNETSLRGFATSLGSLEFFKGHPERMFDAIQKLEGLFKGGGNDYQQFSMYRAIQDTAQDKGITMSPSDVANRQSVGMFGNGKSTIDHLKAANLPGLAKTMGVSGEDVAKRFLENTYKDATQNGKYTDNGASFNHFQLTTGQGLDTYADMVKNHGKTSKKQVQQYMDSQKTPEERQKNTMESFGGSVVKFEKQVDDIKNTISKDMITGVTKFVEGVGKFDDAVNKFVGKLLGVDEKPEFGKSSSDFVTQAAGKGGFAPSTGDVEEYQKKNNSIMGTLKLGFANKRYKKSYEDLSEKQRNMVDADIEVHLAAERDRKLHDQAQHMQAYARFKKEGKSFDAKTPAEKDIQKDAEGGLFGLGALTPEQMDQKYERPITNKKRFDAFLNNEPDPTAKPPTFDKANLNDMGLLGDQKDTEKKSRGGLIALAGGGDPAKAMREAFMGKEKKEEPKKDDKDHSMLSIANHFIDVVKSGGEAKASGRARGGWIGFGEGGDTERFKDTVDKDGSIDSAGHKRVRSWLKSAWDAISSKGDAKADADPYGTLGKHAHEGNQALRKARGGWIGFDGGGAAYGTMPGRAVRSDAMESAFKSKDDGEDNRTSYQKNNNWFSRLWNRFSSGQDMESGETINALHRMAELNKKSVVETIWGSGEAKAKAIGGPIGHDTVRGFKRGGDAMGTDTIKAMLTPGEFVVNARDASRNMMALTHANSGGKITAAAGGGLMGDDDAMGGGKSPFPDSIRLDSGSHEAAVGANTQAISALTQMLAGGGKVQMRDMPRGARLRHG